MKKKELCEKANVSPSTMSKLGRNETVSIEIIENICLALNCTANDVLDFIPDGKQETTTVQIFSKDSEK